MIEKSWIEVESYWGVTVKNAMLIHRSGAKGLVVLFPGGDYRCDAPLLHYARKGLLLAGYDVLSLEYGFQVANVGFHFDQINYLVDEAVDAVRQILTQEYARIIFINKSLGTWVAGEVSKELGYEGIQNLYMTPIPQTIPHIQAQECEVVIGTKDKFFQQEEIDQIKQLPLVRLHVIEGAGHSLEIRDDYQESLRILGRVTEICVNFAEG